MFKRIVLDNFKSFRHIEMDLVDRKSRNTAKKYALIYGENGSGKTNLIESVSFLKDTATTLINISKFNESRLNYENAFGEELISLNGDDMLEMIVASNSMKALGKAVGRMRSIGSTENLRTKYVFEVDGEDVEYTMEFDDKRIVHEKLRTRIDGHARTVFDISAGDTDGKISMRCSDALFTDPQYRKKVSDSVNQFWGNHTFISIMNDQFKQNNAAYMESNTWSGLDHTLDYLNSILVDCTGPLKMMTGLGSPFLMRLENGNISASDVPELKIYEKALDRFFTRLYSDVDGVRYDLAEHGSRTEYRLRVLRRVGDSVIEVPMSEESSGARKLLDLMPVLIGCASGKTAFIDEMDTSIHDKLMYDLFAEILPAMKGQLVATTHNTSLLQSADPRNILIITIDRNGGKNISTLSNIKRTQRNNNNRDRYLRGEFGGIPIIGPVDIDNIAENVDKGLKELE